MVTDIIAATVNDREEARRQYELERTLARRLRAAPKGERESLYAAIYAELYRRFPHLDEGRSTEPAEGRRLQVAKELEYLEPLLSRDLSVVEFGAGDGALAAELAARAGRVWAVDAVPRWRAGLEDLDTLELVVATGRMPGIADGSIDLIYSCHFVEHLHPEDLVDHLREARRLLKPGGRYICVTPNRILGPHDVSRAFSRVAIGLHLQEYSHRSLRRALRSQGFTDVQVLWRPGRRPRPFSTPAYLFAERMVGLLPRRLRHRLLSSRLLSGKRRPFRPFEQVKLVATR